MLKIKANLRGARGSGQYHIGVWEQRGHRPPCDILFPQVITTSLHSFSSLDFLSGSSHHALLSAFNSFFSHLARKEEDWSAVCQAVSAAVPRGAGGRRPGEKKDLTWCESRTWYWVRPPPKCRSSQEGRLLLLCLLLASCLSRERQQLVSIPGEWHLECPLS